MVSRRDGLVVVPRHEDVVSDYSVAACVGTAHTSRTHARTHAVNQRVCPVTTHVLFRGRVVVEMESLNEPEHHSPVRKRRSTGVDPRDVQLPKIRGKRVAQAVGEHVAHHLCKHHPSTRTLQTDATVLRGNPLAKQPSPQCAYPIPTKHRSGVSAAAFPLRA